MMAWVKDNFNLGMFLTNVMDVIIVDTGDQMGMSIQPAIPYGIDQQIFITRDKIAWSVTPNEILKNLYLAKVDDAMNLLMDYYDRLKEQQKEKSKNLH